MNAIEEIQALTNFLKNFVTKNESLFIYDTAHGRTGKKYAISEKLEFEGQTTAINPKTKFMTYDEMNCFFMGMLTIKENRISF